MQNYLSLKEYLLSKPESYLDHPFGDDVSVFKVKSKMFALIARRNGKLMLNLKCDPLESVSLRDVFSSSITEGYHMDKKHWISIYFENDIPDSEVIRLIDNSYLLVVSKMRKKDQTSILLKL
ncbi:MAG: MmcQ/YjbR family DNA-binding protein [Alteromonadaceae bacterium]|nr:MmcQ/YjbR family DNA-binding protein [Alteromonadaceae bacterium]